MKRVFVESNWVFDFCAPAHWQKPDAKDLADRAANGEFKVYLPSVALREGEDAIRRKYQPKVVNPLEDFRRWAVANNLLTQAEARAAQPLLEAFRAKAQSGIDTLTTRVDAIANLPGFEVFALTDEMLNKAIALRSVADLKPFDETIFAAVLVKAAEVHEPSDELFFCELDGDLAPFTKKGDPRSQFQAEYDALGIKFRRDFQVP